MILCDRDIDARVKSGDIQIEPFDWRQLQPASYDLLLGDSFRVFNTTEHSMVDVRDIPEDLTRVVTIREDGFFILHPGDFVLGSSIERFRIGPYFLGRLEGKSSLGRLGIIVHATAGFIDPGFNGHVTLELTNVSGTPVKLYPGMRIGQMSFAHLTRAPERLYGDESLDSKYQNQGDVPVASKADLDFKNG